MRLKKTVGSTTYTYAYNGSLLTNVASSAGQNVHIRYDSEGKPVHMQYNKDGDEYYYMLDAQGNVVGLVDGSGKLVVEYTYDAWGQILSMTGSRANDLGKANPLRYRSYVYDDETGMYYLGSRYYNPTMCRFINADSVSVVHEASGKLTDKNLFAYCDNNPVMRKDGGGEFWNVLAGAVIGAITNVATTVISNAASGDKTNFGQILVAAASGAASGALASTGVGVLSGYAGQVIGNAVISFTESVASDIAGGKKLNDGSVWGKAVFNSAISAACAVIAGPSIANGNKELQEARAMARADQKTRNSTVGAWLSGTASRASASAAQQAYKTSARKVRTVAQSAMLETCVAFSLSTSHATTLKFMVSLGFK
ncbi:MAG: RHS repeat-associated core domain-containing protein [Lachnospiraceae bacterium]